MVHHPLTSRRHIVSLTPMPSDAGFFAIMGVFLCIVLAMLEAFLP